MKDKDGVMLQMNENGEFELYKEPFATIEVKSEKDFHKISKALELGNGLLGLMRLCPLADKLAQIEGEVEFAYQCNLSDKTLSPLERVNMITEMNKSLGVLKLLKEVVELS